MPKRVAEAQIFEAAVTVLARRGYSAATTQEIAALAGINEATLFRRFGTKAELIARTIDHQLADTPLDKLAYSGQLATDLEAVVDAYIQTNQTHGDVVLILLQEIPRHPDLRASFGTPLSNIQGVAQIIGRYQAQGDLIKESPWLTLGALIGPVVVNGLFRRADLAPGVPEIDVSAHVQAFLAGRRSEPSSARRT